MARGEWLARDDRGASAVEFVMMSVLLVMLLFAVLQVAVYVYVRNVVAASAADGARFAASSGADIASGGEHASGGIRAGLSQAAAARIACVSRRSLDSDSGLATVAVRCRGRLRPILLPVGLRFRVDVTASALQEQGP
ncbi:MAG TPA: TadE/TadG family type IV pilus assembly protein [Jatrophihabitantaceae bacterium]|nr:TadE/TadG family type IV pilus assembly protein [Jatrophihabitantaceae bacterium]